MFSLLAKDVVNSADCASFCNGATLRHVQKKFNRLVLRFTPWRNVAERPSYHTRYLIVGLEPLATRGGMAQITLTNKNILGEIDSPDILAYLHVPARNLRNYRLLRVDQTGRAYSDSKPMTAMAIGFNAHYDPFDWNS